jgi:hypothetical protein
MPRLEDGGFCVEEMCLARMPQLTLSFVVSTHDIGNRAARGSG